MYDTSIQTTDDFDTLADGAWSHSAAVSQVANRPPIAVQGLTLSFGARYKTQIDFTGSGICFRLRKSDGTWTDWSILADNRNT